MNPLKRDAANFAQGVKIEKFVSNAANLKKHVCKKHSKELIVCYECVGSAQN